MQNKKRWLTYQRSDDNLFEHLKKLRNFTDLEIEFDFIKQLHDPLLLPDMEKAINIIRSLDQKKDKILIFGDYDSDGTPATALLVKGLRRCGFNVEGELPKRQVGYGLRDELIISYAKKYSVLITVDNGITSVEQIELAKKLNLQVIILDHHLPLEKLPPADAIVDPFVKNSIYPYPYLCGCAIGYKFLVGLSRYYPELTESFLKWNLDLVAISTVSDMMPLRDENRALVHFGMKVLSKTRNIGLNELIEQAGLDRANITAETIGYGIGPRLNASGRMGDNRPALELLLTDDKKQAEILARDINKSNLLRQKQLLETVEKARQIVWLQNSRNDRLLFVNGKDWPIGVLGLVASRLSNEFYRPVLVANEKDGILTGSARSIEAFNLVSGLELFGQYLLRFGGHKQAAGFALKKADLEKFLLAIKRHAQKIITKKDLIKVETADCILKPTELNLDTYKEILKFAPFGQGNKEPRFILPEATIRSRQKIGKKGEHLRLSVNYLDQEIETVAFGFADSFDLTKAHLLVGLQNNSYNGRDKIQAKLFDYLPITQDFEILPVDDKK